MELKYLFGAILAISASMAAAMWNNLNCPAPRAPDNGLSFIFRNGELVHFRCHPGYLMRGKPVAYCVNSVWTEPAPECVPIRKWDGYSQAEAQGPGTSYHHRRPQNIRHHNVTHESRSRLDKQRQLFNWGDEPSPHKKNSVYGDGPRRLPLINGIWPAQDHAERVMALGPQSTPGPKTLVKEEIAIAELRHRQLEELRKQRHSIVGDYGRGKPRRKDHNKNSVLVDEFETPRETVISLGNTDDGDALSIAFAKRSNDTDQASRHRYRHRDGRKKKRHGKGKKHHQVQPTYPSYIIARSSRVDTSGISPYHTRYQFQRQPLVDPSRSNAVSELRRRPVERVRHLQSLEDFDASCMESLYGREVPMIAPQVPHAFVYRYETKKNLAYPFNGYMRVMYRCLSGYTFANADARTLYCMKASWVGEMPRCVSVRV